MRKGFVVLSVVAILLNGLPIFAQLPILKGTADPGTCERLEHAIANNTKTSNNTVIELVSGSLAK